MKDKIFESLRRSAGKMPQADFDAIRKADVAPMDKHDYITQQGDAKPHRPVRRLAAVAACAVCLIALAFGGGWYWQYGMVDSVVDIDLNPSYDISVNRKGQILAITPMNEEARQVLHGRNYQGWDIEEAIYTLFSDLPHHGFFDSGESTVLVSVSGRNAGRVSQLGEQVSQAIGYSFAGTPVSSTVVTQKYKHNSELLKRASEYGVSPGKMHIADLLLQQGAPYTEAQLAAMDIKNLLSLAHEYGLEGLVDHYYPGTPATEPDDSDYSDAGSSSPSSPAPPQNPVPTPIPTPTPTPNPTPNPAPAPNPNPVPPGNDSGYDDSPYEDSGYDD